MEIADVMIGWFGVAMGIFIPLPQAWKIYKTRKTKDIAIGTYVSIVIAVSAYLFHSLYIQDVIFITAQSANLIINTSILIYLLRQRNQQK